MENLKESFSSEAKQVIIEYLLREGYATYAERFQDYKFIVADFYHGSYIPVAAMFPKFAEIVINPSLFDENLVRNVKDYDDKVMKQLSVVVRHELLHFLLVHQRRLQDHLAAKHSEWGKQYSKVAINEIGNYAMDYDISLEGYDDDDKERVRLMTINGRVVGGLLAEDDHPDWGKKSMEEMFDIIMDEHIKNQKVKPKTKVTVHRATHSKEYQDMYNRIIRDYQNKSYSDGDLATILSSALADGVVADPQTGEIILDQGE